MPVKCSPIIDILMKSFLKVCVISSIMASTVNFLNIHKNIPKENNHKVINRMTS